MRILHVVTLVTPDGSLGGPLRVACNQLSELRKLGHEVLLAAAAEGFSGSFPDSYGGVPVKLFPARRALPRAGFAGICAPGLMRWLRSQGASFDVAQIHMARDLVTLPAARALQRLGVPTVLQTHGMIDPSERLLAKPLDRWATRPALRAAGRILHLTETETQGMLAVDPTLSRRNIEIIPNGVPSAPVSASPDSEAPEVLFLARLQERKHPLDFVESAQRLAPRYPRAMFTLVGPDEGQGEQTARRIREDDAGGRIRWEGALPADRTLERMSRAALYVLPSHSEPYPMSVLEAMSVGLPVVLMEDCGLAPLVERSGGGVVVRHRSGELDAAIAGLLDSPERRAELGRKGRRFVEEHVSMGSIAAQLLQVYEGLIS